MHFPPIRTTRFSAELKELSIRDAVHLAGMPGLNHEQATTHLLSCVIKSATADMDSKAWTVQERMLAVGYYLSSVLGEPNFPIGKQGVFTDYLDGDIDSVAGPVEVGLVGGDAWSMRQLTGGMAESIERKHGDIAGIDGRFHWLLGCMAAQLVIKGEAPASPANEGLFDEFMESRMRVFAAYPESDFEQLLYAFYAGRKKLQHLFAIDLDGQGIVVLPKLTGGSETVLSPARFQLSACPSRLAFAMAGKPVADG